MIDTLKDVNNENDLKRVKTLFNEMLNCIGITYEEFKEIEDVDNKNSTHIIGKHSIV